MLVIEAVAFSLRQQVRERRLTPDLWLLRESIANGEIETMEHCPGKFMVADGMTKYTVQGRQVVTQAMIGKIALPNQAPKSSHPESKPKPNRHRVHFTEDRKGDRCEDVGSSGDAEPGLVT